MGSIMDPPASAVIREAREYKESSLANADGVQYMDHLADLIAGQDNLDVVLRSDDEVYHDVAVRAWWNYGRYDFDNPDRELRSKLAFEVPDEVSRRIQSRHASHVMKKFFGAHADVQLSEAVLGHSSDETRRVQERWNGNGETVEILNDWELLKTAIDTTAKDSTGHLGGQLVRLASSLYDTTTGLARVEGQQLQIYIPPQTVNAITKLWSSAFKETLGIK